MTIRNRLQDLRIRAAAAARAFERPDLLEPPPYRVLRLGNVGFPDCTAEARAELWGQRVANGQCCMSPWRCAQRYCPLPL